MNSGAATRLLAAILGFWLIMRSVNKDATSRTLVDYITGGTGSASALLPASSSASSPSASATSGFLGAIGNVARGVQVNPFSSNATGSRLDQGFDLTSSKFLAPAPSKIVYSTPSDSGWAGGGYVAGKVLSGPQAGKVWYMAEGILPKVSVGQTVPAGSIIGVPSRNPYNGILGNIEAGFANPAAPAQPLAQVSSDKPAAALSFYNWIRGLGGPAASSTSLAGYP